MGYNWCDDNTKDFYNSLAEEEIVESAPEEECEEIIKKASADNFTFDSAFDMQKEAGLGDLWKSVKSFASKMVGKKPVKKAIYRSSLGVKIPMVKSTQEMVNHFRTLPHNERMSIIAKARAIAGNMMEPAMKRRQAKGVLKHLEGII